MDDAAKKRLLLGLLVFSMIVLLYTSITSTWLIFTDDATSNDTRFSLKDMTDVKGTATKGTSMVWSTSDDAFVFKEVMPANATDTMSEADCTFYEVTAVSGVSPFMISSNYVRGQRINGTLQVSMSVSRSNQDAADATKELAAGTKLMRFPDGWHPAADVMLPTGNLQSYMTPLQIDSDGDLYTVGKWEPTTGTELTGTFVILPPKAS